MANSYLVSGMTCEGCVRAVRNAIKRAAPGADVEVELASGTVTVEGVDDESVIAQAVEDAGFGFGGPA